MSVKLFAAIRDVVGADQIELTLSDAADIAEIRASLVQQFPELAAYSPHLSFAVNQAYATETTRVTTADEIACIPPVSGG
ncbi:MAG: MoaD/ThiS family protein [Blastopirellula sp. JB062]